VRRANATIRFYRTDGPFAKPKAGACGTAAAFSRRIAAAASGADILVANVGMHYNRPAPASRAASWRAKNEPDAAHSPTAYESAGKTLLDRLEEAAEGGALALAMESFVQHFFTDDGSGDYAHRDPAEERREQSRVGRLKAQGGPWEGCRCGQLGQSSAGRPDWRNERLAAWLQARSEQAGGAGRPRVALLPLAALLRPMHDLHQTRRQCDSPASGGQFKDCLHICMHPRTWEVLTEPLFRRVVNWAHERGWGGPAGAALALPPQPKSKGRAKRRGAFGLRSKKAFEV